MRKLEVEIALLRAKTIIAAAEMDAEIRYAFIKAMRSGMTAGEAQKEVCPDVDYGVLAQVISEELEGSAPTSGELLETARALVKVEEAKEGQD